MSGAKRTFKEMHSSDTLKGRGKEYLYNPGQAILDSASDAGELFAPDIPEQEEVPKVPIPDPTTSITQARKRRARAYKSGRQSTILTTGLGG